MIVGKSVTAPARIAGRHAQNIAAVVSIVDQRVAGTLSHVASIENPKYLRLFRRTIDVMKTLGRCYIKTGDTRNSFLERVVDSQATHTKHGIDPNLLRPPQLQGSQFINGQNYNQNILQNIHPSVGPSSSIVIDAIAFASGACIPGE
jgi:hypothetical protein